MRPSRPRISPFGWFVELPAPAGEVLRAPADDPDDPVVRAARAQACVYLFRDRELRELLPPLEAAGGQFLDLAAALVVEDLVRRGQSEAALAPARALAARPGPVGAWAALREADALERSGRPEEARSRLAESLPRRHEEPALLRAMVEALLAFRAGRPGDAVRTLEAVAEHEEHAPEPIRAAWHRARAVYLSLLGDVPRAMLHHRHALDAFRRLGDRYLLTKEYLSLGQTYLEVGELDHAAYFFRKASEVAEEIEHPPLDALIASRTGMLALAGGDLGEAAVHFERDLVITTATGFRHGRAFALRNLGKVRTRLGDPRGGLEYLRESVELFTAQGDPVNRQLSRLEAAAARLALAADEEEVESGRAGLEEVRAVFTELDRPELVAQVQAIEARFLAAEGRIEQARAEMERAVRSLSRHRRPDRVVESRLSFAERLLASDAETEAIDQLRLAWSEATEAGRPALVSAVIDRLGEVSERAVMDLVGEGVVRVTAAPARERWYEATLAGSRAPKVRELLEGLRAVAATDETVLVLGETGTGKEVVAGILHADSARADRDFVALNCGAVPEGLLEAELFGHERGAFTGADERRVGLLEAADGGTVFLDEVGELSPRGQVMLLRFLTDRRVRPVGSTKTRRVDVRVVAATNRDLREEVRGGNFRRDLYFRLAVFPVEVPPLRDRKEDLPELAALFLRHNPTAQEKGVGGLTEAARKALEAHSWPGNLRELDNVMRAAAIRCRGRRILKGDLPPGLLGDPLGHADFPTLAELERRHVAEAMRRTGGHKGRAADLLGIHRNTLTAKLRREGGGGAGSR